MTIEPDDRPGHTPTLFACFLHFDLSFMLWVLLGALGILIAEDLRLSPAQQGMLVALPLLSGSLLRIPMGLLSDRWGGRRVGAAMLAFLFLPLSIGWLAGSSWPVMVVVGLLLGTAGASFAVALPLASAWYPRTDRVSSWVSRPPATAVRSSRISSHPGLRPTSGGTACSPSR